MIIDANNLILGRLASYVAKKAVLGEKVDIVNCERAVVTGKKDDIITRYHRKAKMGIPLQGPYFPKNAEDLVKRTIRGMLPNKQAKGREVLKRIRCYISVPKQFNDKKAETLEVANVKKSSTLNYMSVEEICRMINK